MMTQPSPSSSTAPTTVARRSTRRPLGMSIGVFVLAGVLGAAAGCNPGGDDDASARPVNNPATRASSDGTPAPAVSGGASASDTTGVDTSSASVDEGSVPAVTPPIVDVDESSAAAPSAASSLGVETSAVDTSSVDAGAVLADAGAGADAGVADTGVPDDDQIDDIAEPLPPGIDAGAPIATDLGDGQIVSVVDALNAGEIAQAQAVLPRLQRDAIRAFAQIMIEAHLTESDRFRTLALDQQIAVEDSDVAEGLRQQSDQAVATLTATDVSQVDAAYLQSQIRTHEDAEALLTGLIEGADSEPLRAQLSQLRLDVQGHLQSARALQGSIQSAAP